MKTQIIRRIFLAVIGLFICLNTNNGSIQATNQHLLNTGSKTTTPVSKDQPKTTASFPGNICSDQHPKPITPESKNDHDFDSFDFKHHEKRSVIWKTVANKILAAIYYVVIIVAYLINFKLV